MGVPSFYRWLVNKYPKIVSDVGAGGGGATAPEFDNLYLDMNGIIHPCFHPDDDPFPPTTFDEVFRSTHDFIDHLFDIVKPRKLLFMAIDGVAPRAKMNQQRARRFRSARDAQLAEEHEERLRKQFEAEDKVVLPKEESELSDSNVITPGTEFMHMLSENLRSYINQRLNENPDWGNIKVILSDDKAPGEGEHKIMSFIRAQRASSEYDPNTRHCLYGLDADLIMLALATHEVHFSILREEVLPPNGELRKGTAMENSGRPTTHSAESRGWFKEHPWQPSSSEPAIDMTKSSSSQEARFHVSKRQSYQFLNMSILREYLSLDMEIPSFDKFEFDLERVIDDFIFICFFAGNDFLPRIPSLSIHEGCIDLLMDVYKKEFQNLGGYLVNMQEVNDKKDRYIKLSRVERFILAVGAYEEKIFSKRTHLRDRKLSRILAEYRDAKEDEKNCLEEGTSSDVLGMHNITSIDKLKISAPAVDADTVLENTKELKLKLKDLLRSLSDLFKDGSFGTDKVKFGTPGWRERYYKEKFCAENPTEMESMRKSVVAEYGEGLCWVLQYYFSEIPSWKWFYPHHYGPFASDFRGLSQLKVKFEKGFPFKPFDQLMAVLPPTSSDALPAPYKGLMVDEKSKLIDFYPTEFEVDVDGKRFLWQGLCKLPFIDEERLLMETRKIEGELKDEVKIRNEHTHHQLFLRRSSEMRQKLSSCRERMNSEKIKGSVEIESEIEGIKGTLHVTCEDLIESDDDKKYEYSTDAICMFYEIPRCLHNVPRLLEGVNIPEKTVYRDDLEETVLWHDHRNGAWRNNCTSHNQESDMASQFAGRGFSLGRGKTSLPQESPTRGAVGLVRPSHLDYGNTGHQQSATTYAPRAGSFRRDERGGSEAGLFRPLYRDYGNMGHQQSSTTYTPNSGSNHRATSSYGPYDYGNTGHQQSATTYAPRAGSFMRDERGGSEAGLFRPLYRDYGNMGHQQSSTTYTPNSGSNHHATSSYGPYDYGNTGHQQSATTYAPRAGSFMRDERGGSEAGLFRPLYRDYGNMGHQQSSTTYTPNSGSNHHPTSSYGPYDYGNTGHQQSATTYAPRAGSFMRDERGGSEAGLFRPLYRDYGNMGHQQSSTTYTPNSGSNHRATSSYGPYDSNFWQSHGGGASKDWRARNPSGYGRAGNCIAVSGQRQHTYWPLVPNGGRGQGSQRQDGGRGQGRQRQDTYWTGQPFVTNGGRGQGRGRGWSATES